MTQLRHAFIIESSERDAAHHTPVLDDPPMQPTIALQSTDPHTETVLGLDVVVRADTEAVFVQTRPPLTMRFRPRREYHHLWLQ
ncbi:hypothetical protein [Frondihabitans sp. PAMC 28766]|uniref:hypothetical protein n=1 Tax=Frondihabitans sp. PAMC 28766 TaxID=1795630 RepID=UPI001EF6C7D4|nr:hypothetical protein [Frondihabitans sp. PAMC 28766]